MDKDHKLAWAMGGADIASETALWRWVIVQAVLDARSKVLDMSEAKQNHFKQHEHADKWLTGMSADFILVCELARICPIETCQSAKRWLSQIMGQNEG